MTPRMGVNERYVVKSDLHLLTIPADYKEPNYDVAERLAEKKEKQEKTQQNWYVSPDSTCSFYV
jgi:hypothetical protein